MQGRAAIRPESLGASLDILQSLDPATQQSNVPLQLHLAQVNPLAQMGKGRCQLPATTKRSH